jgi:long-chain acyl-CoA synthetase
VQEQLRDSEAVGLFVSTAEQAQKVDSARAQLPHLRHFFSYASLSGWTPLGALLEEGRGRLRDKPRLVDEYRDTLDWDTIATIIYTSGTTGESKGVMLSHGNLLSNMYAAMQVFTPPGRDYVMLNFLPFEPYLRPPEAII